VKTSDGALIIDSVTRGGAAMAAGLLPGDELISIDGMRTRYAGEAARTTVAAGEREIEVLFARAGVVERCALTPRADGSVEIELKVIEPGNALRREWLRSRNDRVHGDRIPVADIEETIAELVDLYGGTMRDSHPQSQDHAAAAPRRGHLGLRGVHNFMGSMKRGSRPSRSAATATSTPRSSSAWRCSSSASSARSSSALAVRDAGNAIRHARVDRRRGRASGLLHDVEEDERRTGVRLSAAAGEAAALESDSRQRTAVSRLRTSQITDSR